ncbi:hypothetical protein AVEN_148102-1 [Araneus ventricosus]|uniref:Uncharacterized protein n=1 Tax=Araneus ventricosus TaxID=182803 RepID=A0A4Y2U4E6_ARAVE|nr:hypothetical protein AVEN_148102-1 [Araneus ventricosus]
MTSTTPEVVPPSPSFGATPARQHLTIDIRIGLHQAHMRGRYSVKSGFEPETLRSQSRDLTTRPLGCTGPPRSPNYPNSHKL